MFRDYIFLMMFIDYINVIKKKLHKREKNVFFQETCFHTNEPKTLQETLQKMEYMFYTSLLLLNIFFIPINTPTFHFSLSKNIFDF